MPPPGSRCSRAGRQAACERVPRPIICSSLMRDCTGFMKTRLTTSGTSMPVSSISTEMAMRGSSSFLNLLDQLAAVFGFVGDHPAQVGPLRVHLIEDILQAQGMLLGHGKNDRLAGQLPGLVLEAHFHHLFPLLAQRVPVADILFQLRARKVDLVRVDALLDQAVALFLAQVDAADALALELGPRGVQAVIHQVAFSIACS